MTERQATNPFVFVVGCPRSGASLAQRMLDNHTDLCIANETRFITRAAAPALRAGGDPPLTPELVKAVRSDRRFYRMELDEAEVEEAAAASQTYGQFVARLYDLRAGKYGKTLSGEKSPGYCRFIPLLHSLCPGARFVHIIRDGRDTALSTMNWATSTRGPGTWALWAQDPIACCALWWTWQTGTGVREGRSLGEQYYLEIRYEELVADPGQQFFRIADFLGISHPPSSGSHEVLASSDPAADAREGEPQSPQRWGNWRTQMQRRDLAVFEGLAFGLLERLDYEFSGTPPDHEVTGRIDRALAWWEQQPFANP